MLISVKNLVKTFHQSNASYSPINNISFNIKKAEIFGIIGKSGAGKSTLLNILSLQSNFTSGNYQMFDKMINTISKKDKDMFIRRTAFIHQGFSLLYNLSVLENIALPLKIRKVDKKNRLQKALEMLDFVGLNDKKDSFPMTLSGGEAQRVAIARALITQPEIIFADEPTSSLDEATAYDILNLLKHINTTYKTTIVFISHQTQLVKYLCHRVLLLNNGEIERLDKIKSNSNTHKDYASILWEDAL